MLEQLRKLSGAVACYERASNENDIVELWKFSSKLERVC